MIEQVLARKEEFRPMQGYVVIGVDTYGDPDEQGPYTAGEFATLDEAKSAGQALKARSDEKIYVWGADGSVVDLNE